VDRAAGTSPAVDERRLGPLGLSLSQPAASSRERLRWSLKLPSTPGHWGDRWGDTHFAEALATALRALGQDVVTRRHGAHASGPIALDDVSLGIRGMYPVEPVPGQLNVLWVISHPDEIDDGELGAHDVVLSASPSWARERGAGVLPQASGFAERDLVTLPPPERRTMVFVGNSAEGRTRPLVHAALESGVDLAVHGRGWEALPHGVWRGEWVPNERLPELYRAHGVVLTDHWPAMARHGFVNNRVFDALSCGARVVCDDVAGLHDLFDPALVAVCEDAASIADKVRAWPPDPPPGVKRPSLSFTDRAERLVAVVREHLRPPK
jgi:hypothetical protein